MPHGYRSNDVGSRCEWGGASVLALVALLAPVSAARAAQAGVTPGASPGAPARGPAPVYTISMAASYDPVERAIEGRQHLRWRNTSSVPVTELQLHLYLNAFANNRTTFFRESGGALRGFRIPARSWGWVEVTTMRTSDGVDLKVVEEAIQPDDGNADDRTVARYPLPSPLPPGASIELDLEFAGQMPGVFARNGAHGDFVLGGQWFPKVGVFEDAGVRGRTEAGWNCHQYHAHSEFYSDFGDYDVSLTLPIRYRGHIGGTGRLVEETVRGEEVTARFVQEGVNDFAWTADPTFVTVRDRFDPGADVPRAEQERVAALLGVAPETLALRPVDITLMVRPEHRVQAGRYLSSAKVALRGFGLRLGAYPYPHLTLVDPPRGALGVGGMEYLTFITLGTHPLLAIPPFDGVLLPELVTIHEFGHNYWMGMVASNEFEESWLDEGINSYYEMVLTDEVYGQSTAFMGLTVTGFESNHRALRAGQYADPIVRESWKFRPGNSYGVSSYDRSAITLRHLEGLVGPAPFARAMRAFFQEWQFRHPCTADFERSFQASTGQDLGWFFEQALHSTRSLDYGVRTMTSVLVPKARGHFWRHGVRGLEGEAHGSEPAKQEDAGDTAPRDQLRNVVVVERLGELIHPVTVELTYADGRVERHRWDGRERWQRLETTGPAALVSAVVDPENLMALDVNRLNNGKWVEPHRAPAAKLLVHLLFWVQNVLAATALVG